MDNGMISLGLVGLRILTLGAQGEEKEEIPTVWDLHSDER
jgi:hypothetical protein